MNFWLVKSEPTEYSYSNLEIEGTVVWSGVRNYQARNYLRQMSVGDLVLFYHSKEGLEVVGCACVSRAAYADPTAEQDNDWSAVDLEPVIRFPTPVKLKRLKLNPKFSDLLLVRSSRLSVSPVSRAHFISILRLGGVHQFFIPD